MITRQRKWLLNAFLEHATPHRLARQELGRDLEAIIKNRSCHQKAFSGNGKYIIGLEKKGTSRGKKQTLQAMALVFHCWVRLAGKSIGLSSKGSKSSVFSYQH